MAAITGVAGQVTVTAGAGVFAGNADTPGVAAHVTIDTGAGVFSGQAKVAGSAAEVDVTAGTGVFAAAGKVTGLAAHVNVTAGAGTAFGATPDADTSGVPAEIDVAGGAGTPAADGKVTPGVAAQVTLTGGSGSFSGGANVTGVGNQVAVTAGAGTVSAEGRVAGAPGQVTVTGGVGSVSFAAAITGIAAGVNVTGGVGIFGGDQVPTFPAAPLGIQVELLLNGSWTDVSDFVYIRDAISISDIGRANEASTIQAGQCALTFNNRDGRFSPKNTSGAYYPYVARNTQLRVSVLAASVSGFAYNGYRFWGEVSEWPPVSDLTGTDDYAQVTASGIWRRLSRATTSIGSAYTRYARALSGLAGYWSMEDGSGSGDFAPGVLGGSLMAFTTGAPNLSATGDFLGSNAVPQLNGATLTGPVTGDVNPVVNRLRFAVEVPAGSDDAPGDTNVADGSVLVSLHTTGTVARAEVSLGLNAAGPFTVRGFNSGGTQIFSGTVSVTVPGVPLLAEVSLANSGANVAWALNLIAPGSASLYGTVSGSVTGHVDDASSVVFNPAGAFMGTAVGQAVLLYASTSLVTAASALNGWAGETALGRFTRLCAEEGIATETIGTTSVVMGPQFDGSFTDVLQTVENSDQGLLYETLDQFGLGYRTYNSMVDQVAKTTLDYSAAMLSAVPATTYDDQHIVNDVTLSNWDGYSYRYQLASGAMSVQDAPNGVGDYPGSTVSVNLDAATEAVAVAQVAKRVLNPGVVDEVRVPNLEVNLARPAVADLFGSIPMTFVGDFVAVANPPSWLTADLQSSQLALGYSEVLSNFSWVITYNTIPEVGYESAFFPGTTASGRSSGSQVTGGQAGSVSAAELGPGSITPSGLASYFTSASIGGITTSIGSAQPVDPNTGDLWIDSGHGFQINRFDGTSFVPVVFNATNVITAGSITATQIQAATITGSLIAAGTILATNIQAGAITTPLIAAGAITAVKIASGTVVAGIVNATTITSATLMAGSIVGGTISGTSVSAATITGGSITGTTLSGGTITGTTISGASITGGTLSGTFSITNPFGTWDASGISVTHISVGGTTGTASLEASSLHVAGVAEADGGFQSPGGNFTVTGAGAISAASLHAAGDCQVDGNMHTNGHTWPLATVSTVTTSVPSSYNSTTQSIITALEGAVNGLVARLQTAGLIS